MKKKRTKKATSPPQVTLGGAVGQKIWKRYVLPLIKDDGLSSRDIAAMLGVSHMTAARWRKYA